MSLTLTLIRHATASWSSGGQIDFDRPLAAGGLEDASQMGIELAKQPFQTDSLVSSPAQRTKETAYLIATEINYPTAKIDWQEKIYNASLSELMDVILAFDDQHQTVTLIGHNPALTSLCNTLCDSEQIDSLPTCGVVQIGFEIESWQQLIPHSGRLLRYDQP